MASFQGENFVKNLQLVERLKEMAERKCCEPGQLVLAWLFTQGDDIFVVPGTKRKRYPGENFNTNSVTLSKEEEPQLMQLVSQAGLSGRRDAGYGTYIDTAPLAE